ncbi:MAG TPA: 2-hydroxychromene-2-carboxylate isomerase [Ramlibacter sp.]|uniref:2-hydroxychromene-2-carboxylate isomerase n=1 Tax=Ramlibacter sp. TaxID=1917967 RepID=UPI002C31D3D9|nr:2-hydroxychromene-2-carboxylate isomerase [Ramlibacter sp.]HVZ46553.1 2-hydroxychromene-2-carboxylate isomerase [Ramlibacter sp.]
MVEFFFDCGSPWTWLGFHNMQKLAAELDVRVNYRPVLLGAIFNAVNPAVLEFREHGSLPKKRYIEKDLQDWARQAGLTVHFPNRVFPLNSVRLMRACVVMQEQGRMIEFANAAFRTYWADQVDLGTLEGLRELCARVGIDAAPLLAAIERPEVKSRLRANTDELMERGGFGTPTIFVGGDDMYFGNDRLGLVREALLQRRASPLTQEP